MPELRLLANRVQELIFEVVEAPEIAAGGDDVLSDPEPEQRLLPDDEGKPGLLVSRLWIVAERWRLLVLRAQSRRLLLVVLR